MARQTLQERWDKLDHDKAQRRLTMASGATALGAAGLRATPLLSRGVVRALRPIKWRPKSALGTRAVAGVKDMGHGGLSQRLERAANTTGIVGAGVGAGSSFKWGSQLKRDIDTQEQQLGLKPKKPVDLAKALTRDADWQANVSPGAARSYKYLKRRERGFRAQSAGAATVAAAGVAGAAGGIYARKPALALTGAATAAGAGHLAGQRWQAAQGWGEHSAAIRRRGIARGQGIPDDVSAAELKELVGKAFGLRLVRPPKPYRFIVQRPGGYVRRGTKTFYRRGTV